MFAILPKGISPKSMQSGTSNSGNFKTLEQPQMNNTDLLGPIPIQYKQPKQQFQYIFNTNKKLTKITKIFTQNLAN